MPIAISVRRDFSDSAYRDTFVRALGSEQISSAYITSGFFSDFTSKQDIWSPDFGITDAMQGKKVFLFGEYGEEKVSLRSLRDSLRTKGLDASAHCLESTGDPRESSMRWHAKISVYLSDLEPVLAVIGSSNLTAPSMFGNSEHRYLPGPHQIQVEADSYFWLKGHIDVAQAMHDVFNYWGQRCSTKIAFNDEKHDSEVATLIESAYEAILSYTWKELD